MKREAAIRITKSLPVNALVLDVGGGADPFPRATHVIDAVPYEGRSTYTVSAMAGLSESRYSKETWCQCDICDREPWPYPNQYFDYVTCSHLLEDVRDPICVCSEMRRIAKA